MKNKRNVILLIGCVCSTIAICVVFGFFGKAKEDVIVNRIVGIVAIISGIGSLLVGVSSIFSTSLDNVREYYSTGDTPEMSKARAVIYNYRYIKLKYSKTVYDQDFDEWVKENVDGKESFLLPTNKKEIFEAADITANFFQMWGLLQYKGFLPIWVFETSSGYSILKLHEGIEDILEFERRNNPFFGGQFTDLCFRIYARNKKAIKTCFDREEKHIKKELDLSVDLSLLSKWESKK